MTRVEVVEPCPTKWRADHNICPTPRATEPGWHRCYQLQHPGGMHTCLCGANMGAEGRFMTQPIPEIQRERFVPRLWVRLVLAACVLLGTCAGVALVLLLS